MTRWRGTPCPPPENNFDKNPHNNLDDLESEAVMMIPNPAPCRVHIVDDLIRDPNVEKPIAHCAAHVPPHPTEMYVENEVILLREPRMNFPVIPL